MKGQDIAGVIGGLGLGAYLLGLAIDQLKHGVLITGRRGQDRMTGAMVYVFAPLEGIVGLG